MSISIERRHNFLLTTIPTNSCCVKEYLEILTEILNVNTGMQCISIFLYTHGIDTVDNFLCPSAGKEEKIIALMHHN